ncbi:hypothetical protein CWI39_0732p0010 [Hamiltosporidium magnivora]|uniref:XPG-I domain-containing protein n=1 Tax=Hamiltosporidium magnivora TaxID=148818 RepID=A0A4Q9LB93_9MICR|nr:hypothetical protein CWI39_0732p0010 [Hamiltosporidium magnivora]
MPIRGFDILKKHIVITAKRPAAVLKDTRFCVDGFWFLKRYALPSNASSAYVFGLDFLTPIQKFISFVQNYSIDVLWIWDGIPIKSSKTDEYFEKAIHAYQSNDFSIFNSHLRRSIEFEEYVIPITELLRSSNISVIRAPYCAMAQASYLSKLGLCSYVFAPTDFLLFEDGEKLVTDFCNFKDICTQVEIITRSEILHNLKLNFYRFQSYSLLLGCEFCPTIPPFSTNFDINSVISIVGGYESVYSAARKCMEQVYNTSSDSIIVEGYLKMFVTTKSLLKFHPVMKENGAVLPLNEIDVPSGIECIFGERYADSFYEKLFNVEVSPLNAPDWSENFYSSKDKTSENKNNEKQNISSERKLDTLDSTLDSTDIFLMKKMFEKDYFSKNILLKLLIFCNFSVQDKLKKTFFKSPPIFESFIYESNIDILRFVRILRNEMLINLPRFDLKYKNFNIQNSCFLEQNKEDYQKYRKYFEEIKPVVKSIGINIEEIDEYLSGMQ